MNEISVASMEIDDSLKAFSLSLARYIAEDPSVLLLLDRVRKIESDPSGWTDLYEKLQKPEELSRFKTKLSLMALDIDWTNIEGSYRRWGEYGWITCSDGKLIGTWDECPNSNVEADKKALSVINKKRIEATCASIEKRSENRAVFFEAYMCFERKLYTACGSLLISLIDGELIRSKSNLSFDNKKTGKKAGNRMVHDTFKDEMYGLPGLFHLELVNYEACISTLFASADGFSCEPKCLNRNYLHHGMNKRKVLRKDCIKLFLAYDKTLHYTHR